MWELILGVVGRHVGVVGISVWLADCLCIGGHLYVPIHTYTPCMFVYPPIHLYVPHTSRGHFGGHLSSISVGQDICLSMSPSIGCQHLYNCMLVILVDHHHCWSLAFSCMTGLDTYVFFLVLFLLLCFCVCGLKAHGCMLKLCALDFF